MNAVVEIDVRRARFIALDKAARAWPCKSVRGFVIDRRIRFHFDDDPGAFIPNQFGANKFARTGKRITFEKMCADNSLAICSASPLEQEERTEVRGFSSFIHKMAFELPSSSPSPSGGRSDPYAGHMFERER